MWYYQYDYIISYRQSISYIGNILLLIIYNNVCNVLHTILELDYNTLIRWPEILIQLEICDDLLLQSTPDKSD